MEGRLIRLKISVAVYFNAYKSEVEYYFDYYTSMGNEEFKKLYPDLDTFAPVYLGRILRIRVCG